MERTVNSESQITRLQQDPSLPKISIHGTSNTDVDWVRITDSETDNVVFSVHQDGTMQSEGWVAGSLPDAYHTSAAVDAESLYVGKCKINM